MRALVICPDSPPSPQTRAGGMVRLRLFMNALAESRASIDVLYFAPEATVGTYGDASALRQAQSDYWGIEIAAVHLAPMRPRRTPDIVSQYLAPLASAASHPFFRAFCGPAQIDAVSTLLRTRFDITVVQRLAAMMPLLGTGLRPHGVVFDLDDVEHRARFRALTTPPLRPGKLAEAASMAAVHRAERQGAALARTTTVCTEADRHYLARLGVRRVRVIANAVPVPAEAITVPTAQTLLFLANFAHPPNTEAITWLARNVWPLVSKRLPQSRLLVAGHPVSVPEEACAGLERVEFLGFVPDLAQLYASARVVCCPILQGGGTRVKLVEAAAYGRAMVSTTIGAEGLALKHGEAIEIADTPQAFADACVRLLTDNAACTKRGRGAREWALRHGNAGRIGAEVKELVQQVASA